MPRQRNDQSAPGQNGKRKIQNDLSMWPVQDVVGWKYDKKQQIYLYEVKWKGYSSEENTWEPEKHLIFVQPLLKKFQADIAADKAYRDSQEKLARKAQYFTEVFTLFSENNYSLKFAMTRELCPQKFNILKDRQSSDLSEEQDSSSKAPVLLDKEGVPVWEVDEVLAWKYDQERKKYLYEVKWHGYSNKDNTWEPAQNLISAKSHLKKFQAQIKQDKACRKNKQKVLKKRLEFYERIEKFSGDQESASLTIPRVICDLTSEIVEESIQQRNQQLLSQSDNYYLQVEEPSLRNESKLNVYIP